MWMTSCLSSPTQILVTSTQQVVDLHEFCLVLLSRNKTDTVRLMLLVLQFADEFEKYCSEVENTAAWGGQLEVSYLHSVTDAFTPLPVIILMYMFVRSLQLRALTQILHKPIEVIQADSPTIKIGEEYESKPITLVYVLMILLPMWKGNNF